ncbi:MAG: NUDIX hydrolase [Rickettsia endosymbiont of Argas persicus]
MINNLKSLLQNYNSIYPEEIKSKKKMLEFLDKNFLVSNFFNESAGHFTASAFLLNSDETKFLLMHHKKLNKWLQLGGHCESDDILAEAMREAREESGINEIVAISDNIFDIDVHYIPQSSKEPSHYHYDIRFLLKTIDNDNFIKNNESYKLKWFSFSKYPQLDIELDRSVSRMIEKFKKI